MCSMMLSSVKLAQNVFLCRKQAPLLTFGLICRENDSIHATAKEEDAKWKTHKMSSLETSTLVLISNFFAKTLDVPTKKRYNTAVLKFIVGDGKPF